MKVLNIYCISNLTKLGENKNKGKFYDLKRVLLTVCTYLEWNSVASLRNPSPGWVSTMSWMRGTKSSGVRDLLLELPLANTKTNWGRSWNFRIFAEPNKLNKLHLNNSFLHYFLLYWFFYVLTDWKWVDPSLFIKSLFIFSMFNFNFRFI